MDGKRRKVLGKYQNKRGEKETKTNQLGTDSNSPCNAIQCRCQTEMEPKQSPRLYWVRQGRHLRTVAGLFRPTHSILSFFLFLTSTRRPSCSTISLLFFCFNSPKCSSVFVCLSGSKRFGFQPATVGQPQSSTCYDQTKVMEGRGCVLRYVSGSIEDP